MISSRCNERVSRRAMLRAVLGLVVLPLTLSVGTSAAYAATISVTTTADELNADGDCSLREAIQAANTDATVDACPPGSGADTIVVPAGTYVLSIAGTDEDANATGDLDVTTDLTIVGAGAASTIVDGARIDRVLHIDPAAAGVTADISGITIQNGLAQLEGFGFTAGGGILNGGTLTHVSNAEPTSTTLTLNNSTVRASTGVTLDVFGGGIANVGTLILNDSAVSENGSPNQAVFGGGINNLTGATATLNRSTVNGNSTGSDGGGIANRGNLTLENSTISGNTGFFGGGISGRATLTLSSSTVTGNSAAFGGGIVNIDLLSLKNTIIAMNTASGSGGDCIGNPPTSLGHNLDSDGTCVLTGPGDISGVDPGLGPLAANGGPTKTHALLASSPAIEAGSSDCPPPLTDQRGVSRPQGTACDIGAFEATIVLIHVAIDIKPGSDPNSINLRSKGVIPVAILTTPEFDTTTVDPSTVCFGDDDTRTQRDCTEKHGTGHVQDADGDGDLDLVLHYETAQTGIDGGDTQACLTGQTFGGSRIAGCDSIKTP